MSFKYVSNLYRRLLRLLCFMSSSVNLPDVLPSASMTIDAYLKQIRPLYIIHGKQLVDDFTVVEVYNFKTHGRERHEYVSAKVKGPGEDEYYYLSFERFGGDAIEDDKLGDTVASSLRFTVLSSSSSVSSLTSLASASTPAPPPLSCNSTRYAEVRVSLIDREYHHPADSLGQTLTIIPDKPLPLYELAIIALAVHIENGQYAPCPNNCYLFAGILAKVIEEEYMLEPTPGTGNAGAWLDMPITRKDKIKARVPAARTLFQEQLAAFNAKIAEERAKLKANLARELGQDKLETELQQVQAELQD